MTPHEIQKIVLEELDGRYWTLLKSYMYCISSDPADEGFKAAYDYDCFTVSFVADKDDFFAFFKACARRGVHVQYNWYATDIIDRATYDCLCREHTPRQPRHQE